MMDVWQGAMGPVGHQAEEVAAQRRQCEASGCCRSSALAEHFPLRGSFVYRDWTGYLQRVGVKGGESARKDRCAWRIRGWMLTPSRRLWER